MDQGKLNREIDRQFNLMEEGDDRKPITEYNRFLFKDEVHYGDAIVQARVIKCLDRFNQTVKGEICDSRGPWILFKVIDILEGDPLGLIDLGSVVLARWNQKSKTYKQYLVSTEPNYICQQLSLMSKLMYLSVEEIIDAKL